MSEKKTKKVMRIVGYYPDLTFHPRAEEFMSINDAVELIDEACPDKNWHVAGKTITSRCGEGLVENAYKTNGDAGEWRVRPIDVVRCLKKTDDATREVKSKAQLKKKEKKVFKKPDIIPMEAFNPDHVMTMEDATTLQSLKDRLRKNEEILESHERKIRKLFVKTGIK